jgi:hypothetical protein
MTVRGKGSNSGGPNAPRLRNGNIDWNRVYINHLKPIICSQIAPNTIRGILYALLSADVLKKSDYGGLKTHLRDWRQDGVIDWNDIADGSGRGVVNEFGDYRDANDIVNKQINWLRNAGPNYRDAYLSNHFRWYGQPHYIELQTEKHAVAGTVSVLVGPEFTRVVFNRGNSGWEGMRQVALRLKRERFTIDLKTGEVLERMNILNPLTGEYGPGIHLWYLGDRDKKGRHMDLEIRDQLGFFGVWKYIDFKRIAVIESQISEFGLIPSGDKGEYQIDALNIANPEKFKKLLLDHIQPFFNEDIHKHLLRQNPARTIDALVHTKIRFLSQRQQNAALKKRSTMVNLLQNWIERRESEKQKLAAVREAAKLLEDSYR